MEKGEIKRKKKERNTKDNIKSFNELKTERQSM